jgi:hypothetical protein
MQKSIAMSSCEAELYALCECIKEVLFLANWLSDFGYKYETPTIYVDNQAAIALATNPVNHARAKHIELVTSLSETQLKMAKSR